MSRRTAPEGFQTNHAALIELIRFGFGIWTPTQMAVLLFHAERSTLYGKEADQHSAGQAVRGIYSRVEHEWIRGPVRVSRATWKRVNDQLDLYPVGPDGGTIKEPPCKVPRVLKRIRRQRGDSGDAPTEYVIDWLAIRQAIEDFKTTVPHSEQLPLLVHTPTPVAHSEPPPWLRKSHPPGSERATPLAQKEPHPWLTMNHTYKEDLNSSDLTVSECPAVQHITQDVERLTSQPVPPTDKLPHQIQKIAAKLGGSDDAVSLFLNEKGKAWRARGTRVERGLILHAMVTEFASWLASRPALTTSAPKPPAEVAEMPERPERPPEPEPQNCPSCKLKTLYIQPNGDQRCASKWCIERSQAAEPIGRASIGVG